MVIVSLLGVLSTFYLKERYRFSTVFASALTTLIFSIPLIVFYADQSHYALIFYAASFLGMSGKEKLPNMFYVMFSGLVLAVVFYLMSDRFVGLGGKLGLTAFLSVLLVSPVIRMLQSLKIKNAKRSIDERKMT
jgi:hypothetical protein